MNELTIIEQQELTAHEEVIERGLETFVEVGIALLAIKGKPDLYRKAYGYSTFEEYCEQRWELGQSRAYQLMDAAKIIQNLKNSTKVELPQTERQARPLASLPPAEQPAVWQRAIETAPNGKVTSAHVQSVVNEHRGEATRRGCVR